MNPENSLTDACVEGFGWLREAAEVTASLPACTPENPKKTTKILKTIFCIKSPPPHNLLSLKIFWQILSRNWSCQIQALLTFWYRPLSNHLNCQLYHLYQPQHCGRNHHSNCLLEGIVCTRWYPLSSEKIPPQIWPSSQFRRKKMIQTVPKTSNLLPKSTKI